MAAVALELETRTVSSSVAQWAHLSDSQLPSPPLVRRYVICFRCFAKKARALAATSGVALRVYWGAGEANKLEMGIGERELVLATKDTKSTK